MKPNTLKDYHLCTVWSLNTKDTHFFIFLYGQLTIFQPDSISCFPTVQEQHKGPAIHTSLFFLPTKDLSTPPILTKLMKERPNYSRKTSKETISTRNECKRAYIHIDMHACIHTHIYKLKEIQTFSNIVRTPKETQTLTKSQIQIESQNVKKKGLFV